MTEYDHGNRVTQHIHEMSPLERSIQAYEQKAKRYYRQKNKKAPVDETPEQRTSREKELSGALAHLHSERRRIKNQAQIEERLEVYRQRGLEVAAEDPEALLKEKHHPTKVLGRHMRAVGRARPSKRHSPHHIIEGKGKQSATSDTRLLLHIFGIRINDPDNGVWLPMHKADKGHWSMPKAPAHSEIHTYNYETWVNSLVALMDSEDSIRAQLVRIRILLRDGRQPAKVTARKDINWSG